MPSHEVYENTSFLISAKGTIHALERLESKVGINVTCHVALERPSELAAVICAVPDTIHPFHITRHETLINPPFHAINHPIGNLYKKDVIEETLLRTPFSMQNRFHSINNILIYVVNRHLTEFS